MSPAPRPTPHATTAPCPACGAETQTVYVPRKWGHPHRYAVACDICGTRGPTCDSGEEARKVWNDWWGSTTAAR